MDNFFFEFLAQINLMIGLRRSSKLLLFGYITICLLAVLILAIYGLPRGIIHKPQ